MLDKIEALWEQDCVIDKTDLTASQIDTAKLHAKYFKIMNKLQIHLNKLYAKKDTFIHLKTDYFKGFLDKETMDKMGWKPFKRTILNSDIPGFIAADQEMIAINLEIQETQQCIKFLESIVRMINNRGYAIRNIIDHEKFINGGY